MMTCHIHISNQILRAMKSNRKEFIRHNVGIDISKDDFKVCFSGMTSNMETVIFGSKSFDNKEEVFYIFFGLG